MTDGKILIKDIVTKLDASDKVFLYSKPFFLWEYRMSLE